MPERGVCQVCGCDDDHACEGGCIWANADATLCSQCAQLPERERLERIEARADELEPGDGFTGFDPSQPPWDDDE